MRRSRTAKIMMIIAMSVILISALAYGQSKLAEVPSNLPDTQRDALTKQKAALLEERNILKGRIDIHNKKLVPKNSPEERELHREAENLKSEIQKHEAASKKFNQAVADAKRALEPVKNPQIEKDIQNMDGRVAVQDGVVNPEELRHELLRTFSNVILKRIEQPNKQAREIMQSFKTGEPPNPVKNIDNLAPGDVILVAPETMRERLKDESRQHLKDILISNGINLLDRWGSDNLSSPASHALIFLGERNSKRWYLDNTSTHGPVIKEEKEFLKEYGQRRMDVATLVGQPLSQHEGKELWRGAHELRNTTRYGIWADDRMVCSETSRWLLVRAGRRIPETQSENKKVFGVDTGLNKKKFVDFSPSDYYENQQYFIIHQLGIHRIEKKEP